MTANSAAYTRLVRAGVMSPTTAARLELEELGVELPDWLRGDPMSTTDHLTTSPIDQQCVWCHDDIPAGQPTELVVERDDKQWWSCSRCVAETRVGAKEGE